MKRFYRFLFSRYFFSAVFILLEMSVITLWGLGIWTNSIYAIFFGYLINLLAVINLITKNTNPEYKIPWLLILITLPLFGTLAYILFYSRPMRKKEARLLEKIYEEIHLEEEASVDSVFSELKNEDTLVAGKALSILGDDVFSGIYKNSECKYLGSGEEYCSELLKALKGARKFIFLEYFIISEGEIWNEMLEILKEKAKAGCEVRVMYDDIGCMKTLPPKYSAALASFGITAVVFNKVSPSLSTTHNNRNHRKICVIDGEIGFTGGVNIADEYVNKRKRFGHWKDGGIMLRGDAVSGLLIQFLCDFALTTDKIEDFSPYLKSVKSLEKCGTGYYIPFSSGPRPTYERPVGKRAIINVINQAKSYVFITTPYLIIDYELTEALRGAAGRGVDVRIITPAIPDKKIVKVMTKSSYPYLMECGIKIFEYSPGFIHEKLIVADDNIAIVGTINLDFRSLVHHYENAVWIYACPEIYNMKKGFLDTQSMSNEIDESEAKLNIIEKITRNLVRAFAPLL
jgi:cardiolipin synthase